eukprot:scaffold56794_cov57-Phaeocystis_antarctica.AAC.4
MAGPLRPSVLTPLAVPSSVCVWLWAARYRTHGGTAAAVYADNSAAAPPLCALSSACPARCASASGQRGTVRIIGSEYRGGTAAAFCVDNSAAAPPLCALSSAVLPYV